MFESSVYAHYIEISNWLKVHLVAFFSLISTTIKEVYKHPLIPLIPNLSEILKPWRINVIEKRKKKRIIIKKN